MRYKLLRLASAMIFMAACSLLAYAQGSSSSLSGLVADPNGAVIAGATVTAKNSATGEEFQAITASNGTYSIPALAAGTYTVTVSASGFKTTVLNDVKVIVGVPGTANADLQVGAATESVVVQGGGEVLQTQSANVSTTLETKQIAQLPLQSRNTIYFLTLLPGVSAAGTASPRNPIINGLPSSAYNVTIDGLNTQDNLNKNTDGFFSFISPSVDAIQEVTLSTATPGAESGGDGAIQIKFVTRSGTNEYHGSGYYYYRDTGFNSNYWFTNRDTAPVDDSTGLRCVDGTNTPVVAGVNELYNSKCHAPRAKALFHQFGGRIGGPLSIPKVFNGKDKAFFFVNFEEFRQPNAVTRQRTILSPQAQAGLFQYVSGGTTKQVNLLTLTAAGVPAATLDPTVASLLTQIRASTATTGGVTTTSDPNLQTFTFSNPTFGRRYLPTVRLDFNLTSKHHLENTYNYQSYATSPDTLNNVDPAFPGFPNHGGQYSNRFAESLTLRSTLKANLVNEARFGLTGGTVLFFPDVNPGQFTNQGGYALSISAAGITNATVNNGPERRNAPVWDLADTVTWSHHAHSFTFGGQWTQAGLWILDYNNVVPSISFGLASGSTAGTTDPSLALFNSTNAPINFPGASSTQIAAAQNIYAVLMGHVTAINATAALDEKTNQYAYNGAYQRRGRQREFAFFGQDTWRIKPNLTLTGGLRWELQRPFQVLNGVYTQPTVAGLYDVSGAGNLFKPGTLTGSPIQFNQFTSGSDAYNPRNHDFAPSVGFAWTPAAKNGLLKRIIGESGQTVVRGGFSVAYDRQGSATFLNFDVNPGVTLTANRSTALGNLVTGTGTDVLPILLSQSSRLGPPAFPTTPALPLIGASSPTCQVSPVPLNCVAITNQAFAFDPNIKTPYAMSYSLGLQREITKDMAVEVRYVHTVNLQQWIARNLNETNIVENGFLNEFKNAQKNLQANIAAGKGNTFAYTGAAGTSPLPIFLAYFSGLPAASANDPTKYTSSNFASSTFVNQLALFNPTPLTMAGTGGSGLQGTAGFRSNALLAGLPANFFLTNPSNLGGSFVEANGGYSRYDGVTIDLRRRLSKGLLMDINYTFGRGFQGNSFSLRDSWQNGLSATNGGTIEHQFKANWIYELPIGKGKRFLGSPSGTMGNVVDHIIGGWEWDGTARVQTGAILSLGNVRLVGMTAKDLQKAFKLYYNNGADAPPTTLPNGTVVSGFTPGVITFLPQDIINNTIAAFNTSATTATGYSTTFGVPTGRYIAPANNQSCIQAFTGQCTGQTLFLTGPMFTRFDMSAIKRFKITETKNIEIRAEFLNVFNNINFLGNTNITNFSSSTFAQVTSAYRDVNNTQDPGGRLIQAVLRVNF